MTGSRRHSHSWKASPAKKPSRRSWGRWSSGRRGRRRWSRRRTSGNPTPQKTRRKHLHPLPTEKENQLMNANTVTIGEVRLSYVNLFEPRAPQGGGEPKYSVTILLPKGNTAAMEAINGAVEAAKQAGIAKKWGGRLPAKIASSIHDGDGLRDNGEPFGEECRGPLGLHRQLQGKAAGRRPQRPADYRHHRRLFRLLRQRQHQLFSL